MKVITELAIGSILPMLVLLVHLRLRAKPGLGAKISAWTVGVAGLVSAAVVWGGSNLTHLDCGFSCSPDVTPYQVNDAAALGIAALWVVVAVMCVLKSK